MAESTVYSGSPAEGIAVIEAELARTVAEEHAREVEGARTDEAAHLVVEQVDKRALVVFGSADRLIAHFDGAVEVFEGCDELRIARRERLGRSPSSVPRTPTPPLTPKRTAFLTSLPHTSEAVFLISARSGLTVLSS